MQVVVAFAAEVIVMQAACWLEKQRRTQQGALDAPLLHPRRATADAEVQAGEPDPLLLGPGDEEAELIDGAIGEGAVGVASFHIDDELIAGFQAPGIEGDNDFFEFEAPAP